MRERERERERERGRERPMDRHMDCHKMQSERGRKKYHMRRDR